MPRPPGLDLLLCGSCPNLTSRSKPFSRKMGPKVWKSSDLEQQGLGKRATPCARPQSRRGPHSWEQPQGKGEYRPQPGLSMQQQGTGPAVGGEEVGRDHRSHLVELSPSMADSISSSQSSSRRPLGDALLELEPPTASPWEPTWPEARLWMLDLPVGLLVSGGVPEFMKGGGVK